MNYIKAFIFVIIAYMFTFAFSFGAAYLAEVDFLNQDHKTWGNLMYVMIALGTSVIVGLLASRYFKDEEIESTRKNGIIFGVLFFIISAIIDIVLYFSLEFSNPCSGNIVLYGGQLFFWINIIFTLLATTVAARLDEIY